MPLTRWFWFDWIVAGRIPMNTPPSLCHIAEQGCFCPRFDAVEYMDAVAMTEVNDLGHRPMLRLLDSLRFGVVVVTPDMQLVYQNQTIVKIFQNLPVPTANGLPKALIAYCNQFMLEADAAADEPLILECQPCKGRLLRWQISWFPEPLPQAPGQQCLLVVLEDCYQDLVTQMRRDQKCYRLTDQEARVWVMLKFGMSYQEIADSLSITINTVKTHARNVYNKQRNHRPQAPRLWFLEDELICNTSQHDHEAI
jgi:DNA-binding CsgD family transcriptional regulator